MCRGAAWKNSGVRIAPLDLADTASYEQWTEAGSQDLERRAHRRWKEMLEAYQAPPLDPAIDEALQDFMARKKAAAPDQWH